MSDLVKHVINCFNNANTWKTKLSDTVFSLEGMSGYKTRVFYNELCSLKFPDRKTEYLEVGAWKGSTLCASMYNNEHCNGTVVENWALFGGPKEEFDHHVKYFGFQDRLTVFEEDVFSFDISKLKNPIDIYLYDGCHEEISQYKGITHMWPALADQAIIIVDDWNATHIRKGTFDGFAAVGANIIEKFEITYTFDDQHTPLPIAQREFWNGIGVFVISKNSQ